MSEIKFWPYLNMLKRLQGNWTMKMCKTFALKMTTQNLLLEPYSKHKLSLREVKMALETKNFCTFHLDLILGMGLGCPFCYKNTFGTLLYKLETP